LQAALKRKLAPPEPGVFATVEHLALLCCNKNLGNGQTTNVNLRFLLGLVGLSSTGPKPELVLRLHEGKQKLVDYAEISVADLSGNIASQTDQAQCESEDDEDSTDSDDDDNCCMACHKSDESMGNVMFACAVCGGACHQKCVQGGRDDLAPWVCDACNRAQGTSGSEFQLEEAEVESTAKRKQAKKDAKKRATERKREDRKSAAGARVKRPKPKPKPKPKAKPSSSSDSSSDSSSSSSSSSSSGSDSDDDSDSSSD
jgi:hypothetical protein